MRILAEQPKISPANRRPTGAPAMPARQVPPPVPVPSHQPSAQRLLRSYADGQAGGHPHRTSPFWGDALSPHASSPQPSPSPQAGSPCPQAKRTLQPLRASNDESFTAPPSVHDVLSAPGQSLDTASRAFFEPRLGFDLQSIRIHTDQRAGASARAIGARAYTVGHNIVFAPGQFAPATSGGRHLLAHELTHTIQQATADSPRIARVPDASGTRQGRYTFSANCGWIDWSHADPGLTTALIQRVQQASDALGAAGAAATASTGQLTTPTMTSTPLGVVLSSAGLRVRLLRPLSGGEVHQVALSLFKTLSIAFETQQSWTDLLAQSSFAQEDLPSNLIAFYRAVHGYSQQDVASFCGGLSIEGSLAEYERNHAFVRNRSFSPIGATGPWPAQLATINDGAAASLYETERIFATRGSDAFTFCPLYRVVGTIGQTDLFLFSVGGTRFGPGDDLRVVPTFGAYPTTSGSHGHVNMIEVQPARPSDESQLRTAGLSWPLHLPQPVLHCLTSQGNPA